MNMKEFVGADDMINSELELHGWLVDTEDGLFLLDYHNPRDYDYPQRVKILNANIMYVLLSSVYVLGGGLSLLFHEAKIFVREKCREGVFIKSVLVKESLESEYERIDISEEAIDKYVKISGEFKFRKIDLTRDWLDE